jgi:hypothetical protein
MQVTVYYRATICNTDLHTQTNFMCGSLLQRKSGKAPDCDKIECPLLRDLVERMMDPNPAKRLTPENLCGHVAVQLLVYNSPYPAEALVTIGAVLQDDPMTGPQKQAHALLWSLVNEVGQAFLVKSTDVAKVCSCKLPGHLAKYVMCIWHIMCILQPRRAGPGAICTTASRHAR